MNRALPLLTWFLLLGGAAAHAETKFGYVDLQRALNEVEEGKNAKAKLKKEFDGKQATLDQKQDELKKLKAEFDKQSLVLAEDKKRAKQEELQQKFFELQGLYAKLQKELTAQEAELTQDIFKKMGVIIAEIAEREGFTVVLEKNDGGVLYAPPANDLTNELIRRYNDKYKGASPAAAAGAKAKGK